MSAPGADLLVRAATYWSGQAVRYDRWGDLAHGHPRYRQAWTDALARLLDHPDGADPLRVADVGTGTGELALLLAEMGHRVTGYDIAPGMLDRARANVGTATLGGRAERIELVEAAAQQLPLPDGAVDLVISRMVFWALTDPVAALREWRRVLAPDGRIVVIDGLHFEPPETSVGRLRHQLGQAFWGALGRFDRWRGAGSARTVTPRPASPGGSWRSVAEPAELFAASGLTGVRVDWLDEVADAHHETAPPRWRFAGLLPRFYTLTWDARP